MLRILALVEGARCTSMHPLWHADGLTIGLVHNLRAMGLLLRAFSPYFLSRYRILRQSEFSPALGPGDGFVSIYCVASVWLHTGGNVTHYLCSSPRRKVSPQSPTGGQDKQLFGYHISRVNRARPPAYTLLSVILQRRDVRAGCCSDAPL